MLTLCFGPSLIGSFFGGLLAVLVGSLAVIFAKQPPKELDTEREWKLLRMRVSGHPWKARFGRVFGVD